MARTPAQFLQAIADNQVPTGWAWNHDLASNTVRSFRPLADFGSAFETAADAQLNEATPFTAQVLLAAYERVLGPDPCLGDPSVLPFDARRLSASARWTQPQDASIAGIEALAAAYGVTITITEKRRNCCGVMVCGNPLIGHPEQFTWVVGMQAARVVKFRCGAATCGSPLGAIERNTQIECVIRQVAPAHTVPVFAYSAV